MEAIDIKTTQQLIGHYTSDWESLDTSRIIESDPMRNELALKARLQPQSIEYYQWLVANGQYFAYNHAGKKAPAGYRIKCKGCYENSINLTAEGYQYFEGYYFFEGMGQMPIPHAFNVLDGLLYDFTASRHLQEQPLLWWGVCIPTEDVYQLLDQQQYYGDLLPSYYKKLTNGGKTKPA